MSAPSPYLSIVVPLFNEEESVALLYQRITEALDETSYAYELILVDDGSEDGTVEVAQNLAAGDERVRIIQFRANFGQTPAMAAGIDFARGAVIVTMDGDLQNDPKDIPMMVQRLDEGFDLVIGWRRNRQDKLITRKIPSKIANWLIGKVTGIPVKDNGCSLKAYRADTIRRTPLYSEMHRFIPAVTSTVGARILQVPVRHHARQFGQSKYGLARIYKVLLDLTTIRLIVGYLHRPIAWFVRASIIPLIAACLFLMAGVDIAIYRSFSDSLVFFSSAVMLLVSVCFLLALGILTELIKRTAAEQFDLRAPENAFDAGYIDLVESLQEDQTLVEG